MLQSMIICEDRFDEQNALRSGAENADPYPLRIRSAVLNRIPGGLAPSPQKNQKQDSGLSMTGFVRFAQNHCAQFENGRKDHLWQKQKTTTQIT